MDNGREVQEQQDQSSKRRPGCRLAGVMDARDDSEMNLKSRKIPMLQTLHAQTTSMHTGLCSTDAAVELNVSGFYTVASNCRHEH